jgi:hypothetical protein
MEKAISQPKPRKRLYVEFPDTTRVGGDLKTSRKRVEYFLEIEKKEEKKTVWALEWPGTESDRYFPTLETAAQKAMPYHKEMGISLVDAVLIAMNMGVLHATIFTREQAGIEDE